MWAFWADLFDPSDFPPRWKCGQWSSNLGWLHIVSDLAIGSAYFVIPFLLAHYARRYKKFPFRSLVPFFVAFVIMCGFTHVMDATIFWWPAYRLSGLLKFLTAIISWASVFAIIRVTPHFFGLRSASELEKEIAERTADLAESEERLKLAVDVAGLGLMQIDYHAGTAELSSLAAAFFDLPAGKPIPREVVYDRFHPDDRAELERRIAQCIDPSGDGLLAFEHRIVRTDGSVRWLNARKRVFFDEKGPVRGVLISADVTERKLAAMVVEASEERLRLTLEAGSMGTFEVDLKTGKSVWNDVEFRLLGLRPGEIEPGPDAFFRYVHPHDLSDVKSKWDIATRTGKFDVEFRIIRADGELRWIAGAGTFFYSTPEKAEGLPTVTRFLGVNYDITERKQVEAALIASDHLARERAEELAATLDAVPTAIFISHDPECQHMTGNRAANALVRIPRGTEISLSAPEGIKPRHFKAVKDGRELQADELPAQRAAHGIPVQNFEFTLVFDDGTQREMLAYATTLRNAQGQPRGAISVLVEITERKVAEAALKAREAQLLSFVEHAPVAIAMFDRGMNYLAVSQRWLTDYGREKNLVGLNHYDIHSDIPERWKEIHRKALAGEPQSNEEELWVQADGNQLWLRWVARPWLDASGVIGGIIILSEDITLRKQAENKIRTLNAELENRVVQRTAQLQDVNNELESFSYSVSHDLRAPLRAINGFSRILVEDYGNKLPADAQDSLQEICDNAERMGQLIDHLLSFSRLGRQELKKSEVSMNAIVQESMSALSHNQSVEFRVAQIPSAFADALLLKQVWQNLIDNALKYSRSSTPPVVEIGARTSDQETVYFVKDNGVGFDMQYVHKLFKVFNRLHHRDEFEGTGVGLAIVQRVIQRHGGRVWAEAIPKMGATFYFSLPIEG
jgi:PAS domain S-box-containing protein